MKRMPLIFILFSILLIAACGSEKAKPAPEKGQNEVVENEPNEEEQVDEGVVEPTDKEDEEAKVNLADFLMKDGAEAEFKGEGNEFAQYTAKTQWLNDQFVNVYEDNGGTIMLRTFRIDKNKIVVVQEEGEAYDAYMPSEEELKQMEPLYTYLQLPLDKGEKFGGWTVTESAATLETPLQKFTDVIVIEKKEESGGLNRKYFAQGFGEIKREFIMKEGDEEFVVTSTIEKVK